MKKIVLIGITILVLLSLGLAVFAKQKTTVKGNNETEIAYPILELEKISQNDLKITEETKDLDYYFKVKNYDSSNNISQIQQKYIIELKTKNESSLEHIKYSLFLCNEDKTSENILNIENNQTEEITIDGNVKSEYYFKIHIDSVEHNCNINDEISIKLKCKSVQM